MALLIHLLVAVALISVFVPSQAVSEKPLNLSIKTGSDTDSASSNETSSAESENNTNSSSITTTINPLNSNSSNLTPPQLLQNSSLAENSTTFKEGDCNPPTKVNTVYACNNQLNSSFTCSNAEFVLSAGKFVPCHSHDDCKPFQQPNNWCNLPWEYKYTNYGCYCDKKIGSCVIEREHRFTFSRQWAYCIARSEYKCDGKTECLL